MNKSSDENLCKKLSYLLRYGIETDNLEYDQEGYVSLKYLKRKGIIFSNINRIIDVIKDNKTFTMKFEWNDYFIKANSGHGLRVKINNDVAFEYIKKPLPFICYITKNDILQPIINYGIQQNKKKNIRLIDNLRPETISYCRKNSIGIVINMELAMNDGMRFYKSLDDFILTEGLYGKIDYKYFYDIIEI